MQEKIHLFPFQDITSWGSCGKRSVRADVYTELLPIYISQFLISDRSLWIIQHEHLFINTVQGAFKYSSQNIKSYVCRHTAASLKLWTGNTLSHLQKPQVTVEHWIPSPPVSQQPSWSLSYRAFSPWFLHRIRCPRAILPVFSPNNVFGWVFGAMSLPLP